LFSRRGVANADLFHLDIPGPHRNPNVSYMQTGSAKTWHDYVVALIYKGQQSFSTSDELLKEINRKFCDTDKRTTQSLKIRTIQQGDRSADEHVQEFEKAALEAGYEGYHPSLTSYHDVAQPPSSSLKH